MNKEYDQITAFHYAAYRPALHSLILKKCIGTGKQFKSGLDIGCGTGLSTQALLPYCQHVTGIDSSEEMLAHAVSNNHLRFLHFDGKKLPFDDTLFDIVTFAGSWYYAQSQHLLSELVRVGKSPFTVILYDFEICLDHSFSTLNIPLSKTSSPYNHEANFSNFDTANLLLKQTKKETVFIDITATNLAHIMLSSKEHYRLLALKFGENNLFQLLENSLQIERKIHSLKAILYYSIYTQ